MLANKQKRNKNPLNSNPIMIWKKSKCSAKLVCKTQFTFFTGTVETFICWLFFILLSLLEIQMKHILFCRSSFECFGLFVKKNFGACLILIIIYRFLRRLLWIYFNYAQFSEVAELFRVSITLTRINECFGQDVIYLVA